MYTNFMIQIHTDQGTQVLEDAISRVLRRAGIKRPPIDAAEVARRLGYAVLWDASQQSRARIALVRGAPSRTSRPAIFLRPEPRPERVQWAIAHELGEACAGHVIDRLSASPDGSPQNREQLANALATRLLLPMKWFARAAAEFDHEFNSAEGKVCVGQPRAHRTANAGPAHAGYGLDL
jgi:hypothetical protein